MHGGASKSARDEMVGRFERDGGPPLIVLSLKADRTGLNLTAANDVHFDRWWNPAVEDQATDRAFRIGHRRNVQVRKLTCVGTAEERIDTLLAEKTDFAEPTVSSGERWITELDTAQLPPRPIAMQLLPKALGSDVSAERAAIRRLRIPEIGDINRFSSPTKLTGYTRTVPAREPVREVDRRGPVSKHGHKYLRWGLMEAAIAASSHPLYKARYQRTKRRLGRQRGAKVAQIELARRLTEAIWHMLTRNQRLAPAGAVIRLTA